MTLRAILAGLAVPVLALGVAGCTSGRSVAAQAPASTGAAAAATTGASPSDSGGFANPDPSSDQLTGVAQACALISKMAQQISANHVPEAMASLPKLIADGYGLQSDPAAAALASDVQQALTQLADPTSLEQAWAQFHDLSKLPAMPRLMADCK